jgi:hypothetical protein
MEELHTALESSRCFKIFTGQAVTIGWEPTSDGLPAPATSCYTRGRGSARPQGGCDAGREERHWQDGEPVTMHVERGKIQEFAPAELMADLAGCR